MPTVHKFALPRFVQLVRCVSLPCKSQNSENPAPRHVGSGAMARALAPNAVALLQFQSGGSLGCMCMCRSRLVGACAVRSRQLLSASGQRHGARLTVRLPLSSLSGSTGLGHSAPLSCAQPLQLSGNSGCRQGSAAPAGLPSAHQLFAAAAAAHSRTSQLLASAGLLVRGPPISPAPARLQLASSCSPPALLLPLSASCV